MALHLSKRAERITQAEIRVMTIECEKAGGINLAQGVCDTETPLPVRRGAQAAIDEGVNSYTRFDGLAELRAAIARKMRGYNGLEADPETEITVSAGSTGAFYCACLALLDPGDQIILFEPYYGYHLNTLEAVGAVAGYVRTEPPDWSFDEAALERAVTPRTRGIMVNTPANPSGKVYTRAELEIIAEVAERHDLFVFTDEIYEYFLYDGRPHLSPATIPGLRERTITVSGFSKTYSITGWRVGYSVAPRRFAEIIGHMNDLIYVCAPAPLQLGVARGLTELGGDYYEALTVEYTAKRERICGALQTAGLTPNVPQGAYYVLADISRLPGATGKERAMHLLRRAGVASVPGEAFYHDHHGHNLARFCFAKPDAELDEACQRLAQLD
jgi:aminotransferase